MFTDTYFFKRKHTAEKSKQIPISQKMWIFTSLGLGKGEPVRERLRGDIKPSS